jgi:Tol biopolymer transport system component
MTRLLAAVISLLALSAPASGGVAAGDRGISIFDPARLTYLVAAHNPGGSPSELLGKGLCLADPTGAPGDRLTAPAWDWSPAWSSDGGRLAFALNGGLYVQNANASIWSQKKIYEEKYQSLEDGGWSPDGQRIVFAVNEFTPTKPPSSWIGTVRRDGTDVRVLTGNFGGSYSGLAWSPRGDAIALSKGQIYSPHPIDQGIYLINPDGTNERLLARNGVQPSWSPDGASVVFSRYDDSTNSSDLVIIGADGAGERLLTNFPGAEQNPAWSPDGQWIAFEVLATCMYACDTGRAGTHIAVIRPDGTDFHVLRLFPFLMALEPAWRPPGPKRLGPQHACDRGQLPPHGRLHRHR